MRPNLVKTGRLAVCLAGTVLAVAAVSTPASADIVGTLDCNIAGGVGAIVVSQRAVSCTYRSSLGPVELYNGSISRLGVDLGSLSSGRLVYQVIEAGTPAPGALSGAYVGPGFGVTVGAGGGIDGLVGGNGNSITLQPLAATTSTGLNVNAGVGALQLSYVGPAGGPRGRRHHRVYRGRPHGHHHYHHR